MGRRGRVVTTMAGTFLIALLTMFALVAGTAGASDLAAPAAQATATATAGTPGGTATTATATTTGGTAATATATATGGDAATLPNTGAGSNTGLLFMGAAALLVLGVAVSGLLAIRRGQER